MLLHSTGKGNTNVLFAVDSCLLPSLRHTPRNKTQMPMQHGGMAHKPSSGTQSEETLFWMASNMSLVRRKDVAEKGLVFLCEQVFDVGRNHLGLPLFSSYIEFCEGEIKPW